MAHLRGRSGSSGAVRRLRLLTLLGGSLAAFRGPLAPAPSGLARPDPPLSDACLPPVPRPPLLKTTPAPAELARQPSLRRGAGLGGGRGLRARIGPSPSQKAALRLQPRQRLEEKTSHAARPREPCAPAGSYATVAIAMTVTTATSAGRAGGGRRGGGLAGAGRAGGDDALPPRPRSPRPGRASRPAPSECPGGFEDAAGAGGWAEI